MSDAVVWMVFGIVTNSALIVLNFQTLRAWKRSSQSWARLCREQNDDWFKLASEMAREGEEKS